jgi:hypothetical protein
VVPPLPLTKIFQEVFYQSKLMFQIDAVFDFLKHFLGFPFVEPRVACGLPPLLLTKIFENMILSVVEPTAKTTLLLD